MDRHVASSWFRQNGSLKSRNDIRITFVAGQNKAVLSGKPLIEPNTENLVHIVIDVHKKRKKKKKLIIDPTWPPEFGDIEPGPAYKYQLFTPTKYIQFIANISRVNLKGEKFYYEVEYDTNKAPYHMVDLTVKNWIYLAGNLSSSVVQKKKKKGLWDKYLFYAFESSGYEEIMTWIWVDS